MGTCLVTGGAGFIGSHLVDRLIEMGHIVLVADDLSSGKESNIHPEAKFFEFDVRRDSFAKTGLKFDVIYHLAAVSRIPDCTDNPGKAMDVNCQGTINMLETARILGSRFIFAGTSCMYWSKSNASTVYGHSKAIAEEHCTFYQNHYGVPSLIARFFNVYGPRCPQEGPGSTVVGIFERQKAAGEPLTIAGDGTQSRDFIHVSDVVDGLARMYTKIGYSQPFDFGTGRSISVLEIAKMFEPDEMKFIPKRGDEAQSTRCQEFSLRNSWMELDWKPKIEIQNYVKEYINGLGKAD